MKTATDRVRCNFTEPLALELPAILIEDYCEAHVPGIPVPWSVPRIQGRRTRKKQRLHAWQETIVLHTCKLWSQPNTGVIALVLQFHLPTTHARLWGQFVAGTVSYDPVKACWRKCKILLPDLTNLGKAVEDALQGVLYVDDSQVRCQYQTCRWSSPKHAGCQILVAEISPFQD